MNMRQGRNFQAHIMRWRRRITLDDIGDAQNDAAPTPH
jgi:hypothetical protein